MTTTTSTAPAARPVAWRAVTTIAAAEARMLVRDRTALTNAIALPAFLGILWLVSGPGDQPAGGIAGLQVVAVLGCTLLTVATTTLVARRQQRALLRWRSSPAPAAAAVVGPLVPLAVLTVAQTAVLLTATAASSGSTPAAPGVLVVAVVAGAGLSGAAAFLTASRTRTAEAAMVSVTPGLAALVGGAFWIITTPPAEVTWPMLATGGGAVAQLARLGWDGAPAGSGLLELALPAGAVAVALTAAVAVVAARAFRWEPRG
jgi:ABC-2 type transport system permease protein